MLDNIHNILHSLNLGLSILLVLMCLGLIFQGIYIIKKQNNYKIGRSRIVDGIGLMLLFFVLSLL